MKNKKPEKPGIRVLRENQERARVVQMKSEFEGRGKPGECTDRLERMNAYFLIAFFSVVGSAILLLYLILARECL
jgi:hypothetical protein